LLCLNDIRIVIVLLRGAPSFPSFLLNIFLVRACIAELPFLRNLGSFLFVFVVLDVIL
jgi:hypothetical protein